MADNNDTVMLYCHNDACTFISSRYIVVQGSRPKCPECGARLSYERPRRETHIRGQRRYNEY